MEKPETMSKKIKFLLHRIFFKLDGARANRIESRIGFGSVSDSSITFGQPILTTARILFSLSNWDWEGGVTLTCGGFEPLHRIQSIQSYEVACFVYFDGLQWRSCLVLVDS